jgi:sensor histidine kinase YesM
MDSMSTLTAELELLEAYLKIEKVRFGKRLKVIYDIEEDLNVPIPPLILQPLVENAVKHGLMGNRQGGTVTISIRRQGEDVAFSIIDNGVGMDQGTLEPLLKEKAEKGRVGIWNINRRLNIIYGRELSVTSIHGKGTNVSFVLPMERKKYSIYSSN